MSVVAVLRWIREHKSSAAALVFVVAGLIGLVRLSHRVHHLNLKPVAAASEAASAGNASATVAAPLVTPSDRAGTEQNTRTGRMRGEFENAASYLDFIQQAMSRPQDGGKFYALLAWQRCDELAHQPDIAATHTGDDAFHDRAVAMVQALVRRCSGVQSAYPDLHSLVRVVTELRGGTDLLMPAGGRGLFAPAGRDTAEADLAAALRTGDRWAQAQALRANADFLDVGNSTGDDGLDRQLREAGAESVACELKGNCRGGIEAALHCAGTGDCAHEDERDVVRDRVPESARTVYDTVIDALHRRVAPGTIN